MLSDSDTLYMDGTFHVCPCLSLFVAAGLHYSLHGRWCYVPCCIFSVAQKNQRDLRATFQDSKRCHPERCPTEVVPTIFELAAILAIEEVCPDAEICGCFYTTPRLCSDMCHRKNFPENTRTILKYNAMLEEVLHCLPYL